MYKTQAQHEKYWRERKIDWKTAYFDTHDHPHRQMIIDYLKTIRFGSIVEVGCASGPNLYRIAKEFPRAEIGGVDVSKSAIATAKLLLPPTAVLDVASADQMFFGDKSSEAVLSDMTLIYVSNIHGALEEMKRITKRHIILCEFHSNNPLKRLGLKLATGYRAYNYKRLLERHEFHNIEIRKIPERLWPGGEPQKTFGYLITAQI